MHRLLSLHSIDDKHATHVPSDVLHLGVEPLQSASDVQPVGWDVHAPFEHLQLPPVQPVVPVHFRFPDVSSWPDGIFA